ncbi:hypothetical protein N7G274_001333 [Stereocaulon virgatum]|uniref:Rhodopsin domain-containing protein n=1 Tax=Stereocaulon virgatum TaxID=373712 RepID=A0ABR4AR82_9LECA
MLFAVAIGITDIIGAVHGNIGGHIALNQQGLPVFDHTITIFLQCVWAVQLESIGALTFTKMSILLLYRRIFRGRQFQILVWTVTAIVVVWGVLFFFATLFECFPISQVWTTLYGQHRSCYQYRPMILGAAVSNMLVDLMIIAMPWPLIWQLQMPVRQKIAVGGVFTLAALVFGFSIARLVIFLQASKGFTHEYDVTYNLAPSIYWTQVESALAVVSACLPTLRPLLQGFSLESMIRSLRTKFTPHTRLRNRSTAIASTDKRYTRHQHCREIQFHSSLTGFTNKYNDAVVVEVRAEGTRLDDLEAGQNDSQQGIKVPKDNLYHSENR